MSTRTPIPLRPDYSAVSVNQSRSTYRMITARTLAKLDGGKPVEIIKRNWPGDELALRGATAPATTTTSGWALELAPRGFGGFVALAPDSITARLSQLCVGVDLSSVQEVMFGTFGNAPNGTWVGEGSSVPMVQFETGGVVLGPAKKLIIGCAISQDVKDHSAETAVIQIQRAISNAVVATADAALLDNTAGDTKRPVGLLYGAPTITATSNGGLAALTADLSNIAAAMGAATIPTETLMFVTDPASAIRMRALLPSSFPYPIVASSAASTKTLIGLAPSAIAMYLSTPQFEFGDAAVVILDTEPRDNIDTTTVSTQTVRSAYQCNLIAIKCRVRAAWGPLVPGAVQTVSAVSW